MPQTIDSGEQPIPTTLESKEYERKKPLEHVINVPQIKKEKKLQERIQKKGPIVPKKELEPIQRYLITGISFSSIFVLLGFINIQFLYLIPLGPVLFAIIWYYRNKENISSWRKMQPK